MPSTSILIGFWGNVLYFGEKIVIFRSGGSQTELEKEMLNLSNAFSSYRPQTTLVVANKLHKLHANDVQLGAVLDTGFSHPGRAKFYARLATSRGQLYQEVAAENDLRPKTMPHFDLMDGMFFL